MHIGQTVHYYDGPDAAPKPGHVVEIIDGLPTLDVHTSNGFHRIAGVRLRGTDGIGAFEGPFLRGEWPAALPPAKTDEEIRAELEALNEKAAARAAELGMDDKAEDAKAAPAKKLTAAEKKELREAMEKKASGG